MVNQRFLPDFRLVNVGGLKGLFREFMARFHIFPVPRVPVPFNSLETGLLRRLASDRRGACGATSRGVDARWDRLFGTCRGPHVALAGLDLAVVRGGGILRKFADVVHDRFFVVRSVPEVVDARPVGDGCRSSMQLGRTMAPLWCRIARAPPRMRQARLRQLEFDGRSGRVGFR
jgi:hypothetical protein